VTLVRRRWARKLAFGEEQDNFLFCTLEEHFVAGDDFDSVEAVNEEEPELTCVADLQQLGRNDHSEAATRLETADRSNDEGHPNVCEFVGLQSMLPHHLHGDGARWFGKILVPDEWRIPERHSEAGLWIE